MASTEKLDDEFKFMTGRAHSSTFALNHEREFNHESPQNTPLQTVFELCTFICVDFYTRKIVR